MDRHVRATRWKWDTNLHENREIEFRATLVALIPVSSQPMIGPYSETTGPLETIVVAIVFDNETGVYYQLSLNDIKEVILPSRTWGGTTAIAEDLTAPG